MTNIFPPVLESQSPAMPYSGDETTNLELQFMMPETNDVSTIKHIQVVIKYKDTGRPAVNANYAPDGATLFIPAGQDGWPDTYWNYENGKCTLKIPYKCFKNRRVEEDITYSIQVRFGVANIWGSIRDPFAEMSDKFSDFTIWRINQTSTLPSGFGEWSNITTVYCCGEYLVSSDYSLRDFVPDIIFYYEPKYNDPIASCFIHYSYQDFSGTNTKSIVQSGQSQGDGKYTVRASLNIAPVIPIYVSIEATTVNNTRVGATLTIPPISDIGGDIPLFPGPKNSFEPLNLLREELDDGVLGKKIKGSSAVGDYYTVSIYRANIFDFTTIKVAELLDLTAFSEIIFKDYTPEMGEDYQYIALIQTGSSLPKQYISVYPWGFENSGYDRLMKLDSIYFVDKFHQLKIEANTNITSFKRNTSDVFQTTIGSKYPFYSRPAKINYRTFQFSGVVTINSDPTGTFFGNDIENGLYWEDEKEKNLMVLNRDLYKDMQVSKSRVRVGMNALTNEQIIEYGLEEASQIRGPSSIFDDYYARDIYSNLTNHLEDNVVYIERKFREKIMEWVSNGKPKLFRTETEGNMIVMLSAVTFTPQAKTGRTVYQISGTATEIADYSMENLIKYDLIPRSIKSQVISSFPKRLNIGDRVNLENYNAIMYINENLASCFKKDKDGEIDVDDYYIVKQDADIAALQKALDSVTELSFIRGKPQSPIYQNIYYKGNSEIEVGDVKAGPEIEYPTDVVLTDLTKAFLNTGLTFTALDPSVWPDRVYLQSDGKVILQATLDPQEVGLMNAKFYGVKASDGVHDFIFTFRMGNFYKSLSVSPSAEEITVKDTQAMISISLNVSGGVPFPTPATEVPIPYRYTPIKMPYGLEINSRGVLTGRIAQATEPGEVEVLILDSIGNTLIWKIPYNQIRNWPVVTQLPQFIVDYPEVNQFCTIDLKTGISGSGSYSFMVDTSVGESLPANLSLDTSTGIISGTFSTPKDSSTTCYIKIRDNNLTTDTTVWHASVEVQFGSILRPFKFEGPDEIIIDGVTKKGIKIQGPEGMKPEKAGALNPIPLGLVLNTIDLNGETPSGEPYVSGGLPFYSGKKPYYKFSGFGLTPDYVVSSAGLLDGIAQSGKKERIAYVRARDMRGVEVQMPIKIAEIVSNLNYITDPEGETPVELYIGEALAGTGKPFVGSDKKYELQIPVTSEYLNGGFLTPGEGGYKFEIVDPAFNWLEIYPETTTGSRYVTFRQKSEAARPVLSAQRTYVQVRISDNSEPAQTIMIQIALGPIVPEMHWDSGATSETLKLNVTQIGQEASVNLPPIVGGRPPYTVSAASISDAQNLLPFRVYQNENAEYDVTKYRIAGVPEDTTSAPSANMLLSDSSGQTLPFVISGGSAKLPLDYTVLNSTLSQEVVLIKGVSQITAADKLQIFSGVNGNPFGEPDNPYYKYSVAVSGLPDDYINRQDPSISEAVGLKMGEDGVVTGCPGESSSVLILGTDTAKVTVKDTVISRSYTDSTHQWKVPKVVDKIYPLAVSEIYSLNEGQSFSVGPLFSGAIGEAAHPNLEWLCNGKPITPGETIKIDGNVDSGLYWNWKTATLETESIKRVLSGKTLTIKAKISKETRFLVSDYIEQVTVKFPTIVEELNWGTPEGKTDTAVYSIPVQRYEGEPKIFSENLNKVEGAFSLVGGVTPLTWGFSETNPPPDGWSLSASSPGTLEYIIKEVEYGGDFTPYQFVVEVTDSSKPIPKTIKVNVKYNGAIDDIKFNSEVAWPVIPTMPLEEIPGAYQFEINLNDLFKGTIKGGTGNYGYQLVMNDSSQGEVVPYSSAFTPSGISPIPVDVSGYSYPPRNALLYIWDTEMDPSRNRQISKTVSVGEILSTLTYPAVPGQLIRIPTGESGQTFSVEINKSDYFSGGFGELVFSINNYPPYWSSHGGRIEVEYNSSSKIIKFSGVYPEVEQIGDCPRVTIDNALIVMDSFFMSSIKCAVVFEEVKPQQAYLCGVSWNGGSDPKTSFKRTDDAIDFDDPVPYMAGIDNYGSPFDEILPWSGMEIVRDEAAGELVSIPKFYYKMTQKGAGMDIQISSTPLEGFAVSPAHMARGTNHPEKDIVYIGRYHCAESSYKSMRNKFPQVETERHVFRDKISELGENIYQVDFAMRFTIWLLYLVEYANFDCQVAIGYGCGNNNTTVTMGYTDNMPYHTGTTLSARDEYGSSIQYRNIEGLWDNVYDWIDGCYYNGNGLNIILNPDQFNDNSGGTLIGKPTNGQPSELRISSTGGYQMFYPTKSSGSSLTYTCDYWQFNPLSPCLFGGGSYHQYRNRGLFCIYCEDTQTKTPNLGSRVMKL